MRTKKKFDCVAMKRAGARWVCEQIMGMTPEQELAWWQEREAKTKERLRSRQAQGVGK